MEYSNTDTSSKARSTANAVRAQARVENEVDTLVLASMSCFTTTISASKRTRVIALSKCRDALTITVLSSCDCFTSGLEVSAGEEVAKGRQSLSRDVRVWILDPRRVLIIIIK